MKGDGFFTPLSLSQFGSGRRNHALAADADTRAHLAQRFGLAAIDSLVATLEVRRTDGGLSVEGHLIADVVQHCVVSNADVPAHVEEPIAVRYLPEQPPAGEEVELAEEELDILPLAGGEVDLGELVAQSLFLALDPYPLAADDVLAEARRRLQKGRSPRDTDALAPESPFAKLKGR